MKSSTLIFLFIAVLNVATANASNFFSAKFYYVNGQVLKCLSEIPSKPLTKSISYRLTKESAKLSVKSEELKKIVFYSDDNSDSAIIERITTFRLSNYGKTDPPTWMTKVKDGYLSLYVEHNVGFSNMTEPGHNSMVGDYQHACLRKNETYATIVSITLDGTFSVNNNGAFKLYASKYFADYPELADKIKNKVYTYKDLYTVVDLYNEWKKKH